MRFDQPTTREQTMGDYVAIVLRYKWLVAIAAIMVPVAAYLWSAHQPKVYQASSEVYLNTQTSDITTSITGINSNPVYDPDRYAKTQAEIARGPDVAQAAVALSKVPGLASWQLLAKSSVTAREGTDFLDFAVHDTNHAVAAALATAYAQAFRTYKLQLDTSTLTAARVEIQKRLAQLRKATGTDTTTYRELEQKYQDLRTQELLQSPPKVVRTATSAYQIAPNPKRSAELGIVLGLMLGLGGAFIANATDRRVRDLEDVEQELDIPLLGRLPVPRGGKDALTILDGPADAMSEAVSRLRTNFEFANGELQAKVVMVTSAGAQEGKSTSIANLAIALARAGRRVVLVDFDIRRPSLARLFRIPDRYGLTDAVTGIADASTILNPINHTALSSRLRPRRDASAGTLHVVTSGSSHIDPAELVEAPGLMDLLRHLSSRADIVLLDAPPIVITGDAMALTGKVDAVVLVVRLGAVKLPALAELARALRRSPTPVLGFAATHATIDESYMTYGEENVPRVAEVASARKGGQPAHEAPVPRSASGGGGRWTNQPGG
jgi:capsular exopolysaccharide synthesis family protein